MGHTGLVGYTAFRVVEDLVESASEQLKRMEGSGLSETKLL